MNYFQVENLTKSFGDLILFEDISFSIHKGQKFAMIAKNGAGKTTMLNIITKKDTADSGNIIFRNDVSVGYLEQNPVFNEEKTVFDEVFSSSNQLINLIRDYEKAVELDDKKAIEELLVKMDTLKAWDHEVRVKQILTELKILNLDQKIKELSGGQKKRLALANLLINKPDFIILDEPTNHLDIDMIEWLETYLINNTATLLMVTHDRYFLDRVCDNIIEIDDRKVFHYKGNYSYFLDKREERIANTNAEVDKARNLMRKELEWMRRMPKARSTKAKSRIDSFYDLQEKASTKKSDESIKLNVKTARLGKKILEISYLNKSFGDVKILKDFTYIFKRNEKIGIVGNNGTGKSTLLNIITGNIKADSGKFDVGETVVFGYYKQEGIKIDENKRVIDVVRDIAEVVELSDGHKMSVSQFLNYFLFPNDRQYIPVSKLSGGEKRRLYLMTVLMKNPNFLILDEPTNDLDIFTLNVLEDFLQNYQGCVIAVSHDRYFMDKVVDHVFAFEGDGKVKDFPGNYTIYLDKKEAEKKLISAKSKTDTSDKNVRVKPERERKLTFNEKREFEQLEIDIATFEEEKEELEKQMNSGDLPSDELIKKANRFSQLLEILEEKENRWLELSELL
ncbi:MAG TPA: ABC transporter [Bacteroidales bacterium]|nr:MAG: ABC transporter [Bacteroidetes bacterium GWF2_33_38]OFY74603.1 MAG: ABC transporter [Bacteroidetes bacterium RIFOXYA12_FULL_33_9]HBF87587.1 ABC transporter [Bacteroidales bacterium]